ncbi:MAG: carboxypeptidase regulatory-like domain-containing protein, partial [Bryobacteraceae bacterium]
MERQTNSQTTSSAAGRYQIGFLLPGRYHLTVSAPGFKNYVRQNIQLAVAEKLGLDVEIEIGAVTETVTVSAEIGLLDTESSSRGQVVTRRELADLPNQGRNVFQMVWAVAGVTRTRTSWGSMSPQGVANATRMSINGSREGENEVLLDGVSDVHGGRQVKHVPSLETVQEFKVVTNPYDAQYGRTGGGVISFTTKSGTNVLHGAIWEFLANNKFEANSFQNNRAGNSRPQANRNMFGFVVDGPVYLPKLIDGRNKLFFMFSYEGWRFRGTDLQSFTLPLAEQRSGDFSNLFAQDGRLVTIYDPLTTRPGGSGGFLRDPFPGNRLPPGRLNPIAVNAASFYPQPIFAGEGPGQINNYVRPTPNIFDINTVSSRIDYHINSSNRVHFRYSNTPFKEIRALGWGDNVAEPSGNAPLTRNGVNWSFDWTSTMTPRTVLNLRFGLTRWEDFAGNTIGRGYDPRDLGFPDSLVRQFKVLQFPRFDIGDSYGPIGSWRPGNFETDYAYSLQPNLNLVRGGHVLKIGVEFRRFEKNRIPLGVISGQYSFSRAFTQADPLRGDAHSGNEFASFLLG